MVTSNSLIFEFFLNSGSPRTISTHIEDKQEMTTYDIIITQNYCFTQADLNSFLEFDAEVLKDPEALVQLECVLVFAKEIDESTSLFTQIQPASL